MASPYDIFNNPNPNAPGRSDGHNVINPSGGGPRVTPNTNTATGKTTTTAAKPAVNLPSANTPIGDNTVPVPGNPKNVNQQNVADYASQLVKDPEKLITPDMQLSNRTPDINENAEGTNIDINDPKYAMDPGALNQQAATGGAADQMAGIDPQQAASYEAQMTQDNIAQNGQATAQQGQVSQEAQINAEQHNTDAHARGETELGKALNDYASQNISNIIDTSTPAGKALAEQLGEGNYLDSKATLKGQLDILQSEFVDANGNPKIPVWAAATARNVAKIAAFKGMTGTAATAAMSQALMEASIPIAQQDAAFFQTTTLQNLSNKQQSILNKANVLSKMESENLDARMTAAVENSKAFLAMDMANLSNQQQAEILNTQARIQSILEDAKSVNAQRLFEAESQNDMTKFYDNLNASIAQFNTTQSNSMKQFNAQQTNDMSQFNAQMENNREQFYKEMAYNIDLANAKWRQQVTMQEAADAFEAAAVDVKNMVGLSQEQLNKIWDRSDSLLDYAWQSAEKEKDRAALIAMENLKSKLAASNSARAGKGAMLGTIAGKAADSLLSWAFG